MFRCRHCFVDGGQPREHEADTGALTALIEEAALCGVDSIGWSGGEPLLRKDLEQLTAEATSAGVRVGLATNGYLATRTRLAALKKAGLQVVQISLDGADAKSAARYRQGPKQAFTRAVRAVQEGAELGLKTYVCTILTPETAGDVDVMAALATELGATGLRYSTYFPVGRAQGRTQEDQAWAQPVIGEFLQAVRRLSGSDFRILLDCPTGPLPGMGRYVCSAGRGTGYVTADGQLYPCTALLHPDYTAGNVLERPLGVLLNQGKMFKVLRQMASMEPRGECEDCDRQSVCRGGCPGRIVAQYGRLGTRRRRHPMPGCLYRLHEGRTGKDYHVEEEATPTKKSA